MWVSVCWVRLWGGGGVIWCQSAPSHTKYHTAEQSHVCASLPHLHTYQTFLIAGYDSRQAAAEHSTSAWPDCIMFSKQVVRDWSTFILLNGVSERHYGNSQVIINLFRALEYLCILKQCSHKDFLQHSGIPNDARVNRMEYGHKWRWHAHNSVSCTFWSVLLSKESLSTSFRLYAIKRY